MRLILFSMICLLANGPLSAQRRQPFPLEETTISNIHGAFASGQLTCVQLVQLYLSRIESYDDRGPSLNAILTVNPNALQTAADMDKLYVASKSAVRPLHCIPVVLKDNYDTADMPTTGKKTPT